MPARALSSLRFAVRPSVLAHHLGQLALPLGLLSAVPAAVAAATGRMDVAWRGAAVAGALVLLGWIGWRTGSRAVLQRNEALVLTALAFGMASLGGAVPLAAYGLSPVDAVFEAVSGATTTGLSVIPSLDGAPAGLVFARAWLQWVGGLGVLVLTLALIVTPGASARRMGFGSREMDDVAGGTRAHARRVLVIYVSMTAIGFASLVALGGGAAEALMHTLAAVSTGGFGMHDGSLAPLPRRLQTATLILCFAAAVPLSCYYAGAFRSPLRVLRDPQLRGVALLCAGTAAALAALRGLGGGDGSQLPLVDLLLTAVSAQTTAGFSTVPTADSGSAEKLVLIASMFVGGSAGSTAGGVKVLRLLVCLGVLRLLLDRISISSSGRTWLRLGGHRVEPNEVEDVLGVVSAYGVLVVGSWLAFVASGYAPLDSLFEVVSAVGTVGLSAGITGPELPAALKGVLCLDMLMGRVEVVALLVLLRPTTWIGRRRSL